MKRDPELIRDILLRIREESEGLLMGYDEFEDLGSQPEVAYHIQLIRDAEWVKTGTKMGGERPFHPPMRLTHKGHEFLDAVENDTVWEKGRQALQERSVSAGLEVLQSLLKSYAEKKLDLG